MSHKIDGRTPRSPVPGMNGPKPRVESAPGASHVATSDTVDLSDAARLLEALGALLASAPSSDRARVEAIKQAVASGAYEIDPQRIAAQVVRLELDLFGHS